MSSFVVDEANTSLRVKKSFSGNGNTAVNDVAKALAQLNTERACNKNMRFSMGFISMSDL